MSNVIGAGYAPKATFPLPSAAAPASGGKKPAAAQSADGDGFVRAPQFQPDMNKVREMQAAVDGNFSALRNMISALLGSQGKQWNMAFPNLSNLVVDAQTQAEAQAAIADDGPWGVEAVANNILNFAKAISGGDPAKIEMLREAILEGFAMAERVWGGTLPDISHQTLERVMQGLDEWAAV